MSQHYDLARQIRCIERELALRRSAYPKWVKRGQMKPEAAQDEIGAMEAVLQTLKLAEDLEVPF